MPVYLGNIDLYQWYYLDLGVRILHMLLMSWGGDPADEDEAMKNTSKLQKRITQTVTEVRRAGIDQMDVRSPNLLWNQELQRVMLIDFERAAMIKFGPKNNGVHKEAEAVFKQKAKTSRHAHSWDCITKAVAATDDEKRER